MAARECAPIYEYKDFTVVAVLEESGRCPGLAYYEGFSDNQKTHFARVIQKRADDPQWWEPRKFKKLEKEEGLWEYKHKQIRLFGFFDGQRCFVLTNGVDKKDQRHQGRHVEKAHRLRKLYLGQ